MSDAQFNKLEQEQDKWRAYNRELLARQLFTNDEYADEYQSSFLLIHIVDDRYITPSLGILADRLWHSAKSQVACLESIVGRLERFLGPLDHHHPALEALLGRLSSESEDR